MDRKDTEWWWLVLGNIRHPIAGVKRNNEMSDSRY